MKKISLFLLMVISINFSYSQNTHSGSHPTNSNSENSKWNVYGNEIDASDLFGSSNNFPINFITNSVQRMKLGIDGVLQLNTLAGIGNRILVADANGNLIVLPGSVSTAISSWNSNGSNIYLSSGNLGIGTNTPIAKLDVNGDVRISNNLYVGGGIVISDRVQAATEITSLNMTLSNDLNVQGTSRFGGVITATQGIMFDVAGTRGISFIPPAGSDPAIINYGGKMTTPAPSNNICLNPNPPTCINRFASVAQIFQSPDGINYGGGDVLTMQSWTGGSSIDAAGTGGLFVNYFCGKDVGVCTGSNGGIVYMGQKVSTQQNVGIGDSYPNPNYDVNVGLNIYANNTNMDGIRINQWNGTTKAINLVHPSTGISNFVVWQSGNTQIGQKKSVSHPNAQLMVDGTIVCKELYVTKPADWPDYVFKSDYKLLPLNEVEKFYKKEHHLPNIQSEEELEKQDVNIVTISAAMLRKIEELTLYAVEQNKQIESLKKEVGFLKEKK